MSREGLCLASGPSQVRLTRERERERERETKTERGEVKQSTEGGDSYLLRGVVWFDGRQGK